MRAVAAHEKPGELSPQSHVIETWEAVEHVLDGLLQGSRTTMEKDKLAGALTTHTVTIPHFIREYVGEDYTPEVVAEAYLLVAQLQQKPFALYAMANNTGEGMFGFTDWAASESRGVEIMLQAMDRSQEEDCTETFEELVIMNMYIDLCSLLGNNVRTLLMNVSPSALHTTS